MTSSKGPKKTTSSEVAFSDRPATGLGQWSRAIAASQVRAAVRRRYFPEIWYALENWLQLLKGRRALEVGYGLGLIAEAMARQEWQITVADPVVAALAELRDQFRRANLNAALEQADWSRLPFKRDSFDAVVSVNTLELSDNPAAVVSEIHRVLMPGGRALIATFNRLSPWGVGGVVKALRPCPSGRRTKFLSRDEFEAVVSQSGLKINTIVERACYLPLERAANLRLPIAGAFVALVTKS